MVVKNKGTVMASKEQFLNVLFGEFLRESNGYIETREILPNDKG